jgi:hypothetical protein
MSTKTREEMVRYIFYCRLLSFIKSQQRSQYRAGYIAWTTEELVGVSEE